jgi:uncharacterized protein YgbK (DUF1537 family)
MSRIAIVADDLTGANANGSLLAGRGFSAATCLTPEAWDEEDFALIDAVSITTDSRLLPSAEARRKVFDGFRILLAHNAAVVLSKRIDSTLRGNIGSEIEAALAAIDESGRWKEPALAVVVPAFPASQRIAVGGYLVVNGVPLARSPVAHDPASRLDTSKFVDIIARQTDLPIAWVPLATTLDGAVAVRREILERRAAGMRVFACDAVTDDDIATIAEAMREVSFPVLAVDPGPFTAAMADARIGTNVRRELQNNLLVVIGSATDLVRRQVEALRLARSCAIVRADCCALVDPQRRADAIARTVAAISAKAGSAEVYGVCTTECAADVLALDELATRHAISVPKASTRINSGLAEIAEVLLLNPDLRFGGLYTSGGEVTVAVTRQFRALGFSVRDEVLPLAVYGHLIGGRFPGLPMVTKGGFVGDSSGIVRCVDYLLTKISSQRKPSENQGAR